MEYLTCYNCDTADETVKLRTWCEPCGPSFLCEDCNNRHKEEIAYWTQEAQNFEIEGL